MKYLAAYLLVTLSGHTHAPNEKDIKHVLESVGIEVDEERLTTLLSELKDKDINELIAQGSSKLASVSSGGGGAAPAAGGAAAGGAAAAEEKEEEKEEGMSRLLRANKSEANSYHREGGVRRGYGLRSFRLNNQFVSSWIRALSVPSNGQGSWKELCGLGHLFAYRGCKGRQILAFS